MAVLRVSDDGLVRTLTLDRPERLNALGPQMREALENAVSETADSDARVVVLQGAGRCFSAGADLKDAEPTQPTWQRRRRGAGRWGRLLDAIEALPQVTIASLHGHVIGGAVLIAMSCDMRVAAADVQLSIPELAIGIPLTWGGVPRLVREIGMPRTRELVLTGHVVGAAQALAWGLVHRVGDRESETRRLVDELLAMPEGPLAITKDALRAYGRSVVAHEGAWADADLLESSRSNEESRAAAAAYFERFSRRD
jgi:enoyl-CoA hydratase/carnithine racemase